MQFTGKLVNQTWENSEKPHFEPDLGPPGLKFGPPNFLFLNLASSLHNIMVSDHHVQYQKKTNDQFWENIVTDRQMDKSDFIGRCSTN